MKRQNNYMTYNNNLLDPDEFSTDSDYLQEINLDLMAIFVINIDLLGVRGVN